MIDYNQLNGPQRKILREVLTATFRRSANLDQYLVENNYEPLEDIVERGPFKSMAFNFISEYMRLGRLNGLMQQLVVDYADSPDIGELEQRLLLADDRANTQRVIQERGLERAVRNAGLADLNIWATRLVAAGRRICYIAYRTGGNEVEGTGFLVGSDLVLTAYHVVEALDKGSAHPRTVTIDFGYARGSEQVESGERVGLADEWLVAKSPYSDADLSASGALPGGDELDFALLRLNKKLGDEPGDQPRGWYDLKSPGQAAEKDAIVFVLQHPEGKPLQQSIGVVQQQVTPLRLRYDADTEGGSSGGLVLNQLLDPIALHHAGDPRSEIKAEFNQGIPLHLIRAALVDAAIAGFV